MRKLIQQLVLGVIIVSVFLVITKQSQRPPVDWNPTYSTLDKIPYGLYILDQELPHLLQNDSIVKLKESLSDFLQQQDTIIDAVPSSNLLYIGYSMDWTPTLNKDLFAYVQKGNTALFVNAYYPPGFLDTLQIDLVDQFVYNNIKEKHLQLTNKHLNNQQFSYKELSDYAFEVPDTSRGKTWVLGHKTSYGKNNINFIKINVGKGTLLLSTDPIAFTNYALLHSNNHLYAQSVLSYLPEGKTYFLDDTPALSQDKQNVSTSLLRFIFSNSQLKWAWQTLLFTLVVFILFTAKRKQRVITPIAKVENQSVAFLQTLSEVYLQNKDYKSLMDKSLFFTLEKIKQRYTISVHKLDQDFIEQLHIKSNKNKEDISNFVHFALEIRHNNITPNKQNLIKLHQISQKIML